MNSPFMSYFHEQLAERGFLTIKFNFEYIDQKRKMPDPQPKLQARYRTVVSEVIAGHKPQRVIIGGKSMGGRIATQVAAADPTLPIAGLTLLGYPLHPPGRPEQRRDAHLPAVGRPMLLVQGSRDAFGTPGELATSLKSLVPAASVHVVDGGDHSFKLTRRDAEAQQMVYADVQRTIVAWMDRVSDTSARGSPPDR